MDVCENWRRWTVAAGGRTPRGAVHRVRSMVAELAEQRQCDMRQRGTLCTLMPSRSHSILQNGVLGEAPALHTDEAPALHTDEAPALHTGEARRRCCSAA
eukprot:349907-Chlamydomonas_euryale.AAC.6